MPRTAHWLATSLLFGSGLATGLVAEDLTDTSRRVELHRTPLDPDGRMEVIVSTADYPPGSHIPRHFHHGVEAAYVIAGATVRAPGKPAQALATGASVLNRREVAHAGFTVEGETTLRLFTVHVVDADKPLFVPSR